MKFAAFCSLLLASPVLAECPVAADLEGGVRVTESDGTINSFTAQGDGIVQNDGRGPSGYQYRNILAQGTHLIELGDTDGASYINGSRRVVDYQTAAADMPVPQPMSRHSYETVISTETGTYQELQEQAWGRPTTLTVGDCTYDLIPGKAVYTNDDYVVFEGLYYLPALQLALLHSYQIEGEAADTYVAVKIEAVE